MYNSMEFFTKKGCNTFAYVYMYLCMHSYIHSSYPYSLKRYGNYVFAHLMLECKFNPLIVFDSARQILSCET